MDKDGFFSLFNSSNRNFLENLYKDYLNDPQKEHLAEIFNSIAENEINSKPSWAKEGWPEKGFTPKDSAFNGFSEGDEFYSSGQKSPHKSSELSKSNIGQSEQKLLHSQDTIRALMLIRAYRALGHLIADLDPLGLMKRDMPKELDPSHYGFSEDHNRPIFIDNVLGLEWATLTEIITILQNTYCIKSAVEFMHITSPEQKAWLQKRIESKFDAVKIDDKESIEILESLIQAESFEKFLNKKYTGTKRFGLDGGEATIPALKAIIAHGSKLGIEDVVIGMPHRGRLNVLTSVINKPFHQIFHEFSGGSVTPDEIAGSGDVKYHLGASADKIYDGKEIHLSLVANPSHLEAVNPVVMGKARARQDNNKEVSRNKTLPLLLHGDAAFAGQGVVAECFGFSGLKGFNVGGTVHFIVNNQIGFTTSPQFSRSSPYPSDVAKMVEAPIFHVNGNDPLAVVRACKIAIEFRQQFSADVVVDLFCYRRFGHNESDEPKFTQPIMYKSIEQQTHVTDLYNNELIDKNIIDDKFIVQKREEFDKFLEGEFSKGNEVIEKKADWLDGNWSDIENSIDNLKDVVTGYDAKKLQNLAKYLTAFPQDFKIHRTLARIIKNRVSTIENGKDIDWATAEFLAFGSLLEEKFSIRLSGQDSRRGTFSHRHAHYVDQDDEKHFVPLEQINENFEVIDSNLSEFAVLGFEYGYSLEDPNRLCLWEAQFGDFANGAQILIDQFISSAEKKWLRMSGLVLLLPHGYEGQGPEHSSARLERFLQLCAQENMQVANCTTPANYFHILRRQLKRKIRKPLIIMSPKSLLRHKECVSDISEFDKDKSFRKIIIDDEKNLHANQNIKKVVFCSGKIYYDLLAKRRELKNKDVFFVRIEELYPFPKNEIKNAIKKFSKAEFIFAQEEPKNMGSWHYICHKLEDVINEAGFNKRPKYVGRDESASPATGLMSKHILELEKIFTDVFSK